MSLGNSEQAHTQLIYPGAVVDRSVAQISVSTDSNRPDATCRAKQIRSNGFLSLFQLCIFGYAD